MGRPPLCKRVSFWPSVTYYKPAGIPLRDLEEICLTLEELEAIRLKDLEDMEQEECAESMNISRPSFVRIIDSARQKVAEALILGKAIRIEGGNFEMVIRRFRCRNKHEWDIPVEKLANASIQICPACGDDKTEEVAPVRPHGARERRCHRGHNQAE